MVSVMPRQSRIDLTGVPWFDLGTNENGVLCMGINTNSLNDLPLLLRTGPVPIVFLGGTEVGCKQVRPAGSKDCPEKSFELI